jgi:hypothetical protein
MNVVSKEIFKATEVKHNGWIKIGKDQEGYARKGQWKLKKQGSKFYTIVSAEYFKEFYQEINIA